MAAPAIADRPYTPEELLMMEDGGHYELVGGSLLERTVSRGSSKVAIRVGRRIDEHTDAHALGDVYGSELGIRIFADPAEVRRADVSFLAAGRVPPGDSGYLTVAPDLVVEVVSPSDKAAELREKVDLWLGAGVRQVWVLYPQSREVHVYSPSARPQVFTADDEITGGDVVPGFSILVADLFPGA